MRSLRLLLLVSLVACVGPSQPATIENTTFPSSLDVQLKSSTRTASGTYYRDLALGTGAVIAAGQTVAAHYTGWLSNGTQFETNVGGPPFTFVFGASPAQVIGGWDNGLVGAHVGGTRQLVIPPEQAYGPYAVGSIPPNSILVFRVQIDSAQ
jgi:FKBP-type peptidyl-prolyl cis-trans isomerase